MNILHIAVRGSLDDLWLPSVVVLWRERTNERRCACLGAYLSPSFREEGQLDTRGKECDEPPRKESGLYPWMHPKEHGVWLLTSVCGWGVLDDPWFDMENKGQPRASWRAEARSRTLVYAASTASRDETGHNLLTIVDPPKTPWLLILLKTPGAPCTLGGPPQNHPFSLACTWVERLFVVGSLSKHHAYGLFQSVTDVWQVSGELRNPVLSHRSFSPPRESSTPLPKSTLREEKQAPVQQRPWLGCPCRLGGDCTLLFQRFEPEALLDMSLCLPLSNAPPLSLSLLLSLSPSPPQTDEWSASAPVHPFIFRRLRSTIRRPWTARDVARSLAQTNDFVYCSHLSVGQQSQRRQSGCRRSRPC